MQEPGQYEGAGHKHKGEASGGQRPVLAQLEGQADQDRHHDDGVHQAQHHCNKHLSEIMIMTQKSRYIPLFGNEMEILDGDFHR